VNWLGPEGDVAELKTPFCQDHSYTQPGIPMIFSTVPTTACKWGNPITVPISQTEKQDPELSC
jgi:hypothetical protein